MKLAILFLLFFSASMTAAQANDELCTQKKKQYGKNFISCGQVDWGVKPLSADYQPKNAGPMTAPPSAVKGYANDYPGIKNTRYYHDTKFFPDHPDFQGMPLASKFITAVNKDSQKDDDLVKWLSTDWYNAKQPKVQAEPWEGGCDPWSAMSVDPEVLKLFGNFRDGILCNGVPFSKGELKEIVTALYPIPTLDRKNFYKFYSGYLGADQDELEDANIALSKLGMLGQGDIGPAEVLSMAETAKQNGKNMMIEWDPTYREGWNHPIRKVTDVTFADDKIGAWETLTSAEFTQNATSTEQKFFLSNLASVESELTQNLLSGRGIDTNQLCTLRKQLGENCDDLTGKFTMVAQVGVLNKLKQSAFSKKVIQLKQNVSIVKHELIVEYGTENSFASNAPDQTVTRSYTYLSVNTLNGDGSSGSTIRSQWSPNTATLAEICANTSLAEGRNNTAMTRGFEVSKKCANGKPVNDAFSKNEYFTGAVPPNRFMTFTAKPGFTDAQSQQQKAYNKLLEFLATCDRFDGAVDFLKNLDQAMLDNVISPSEVSALTAEYGTVKKLLDQAYIQSILDNKSQGVQGVDSLKTALFPN